MSHPKIRTLDFRLLCPVCKGANDCQIDSDKKCWCFNLSVDKAQLAVAVQDQSKDQCLCQNCLRKLSAP